jgi:hypothetical protein
MTKYSALQSLCVAELTWEDEMTQLEDVAALQRRVRADQRARSIPLLVIGVLLVNYGVDGFTSHPIAWQYGAPLAFVAIWALSKLNESRTGVGLGRTDYLVASAFVFMATELVMLRPFTEWIKSFGRVEGLWTIIIGVAVVGIGAVAADPVLVVAALIVAAAGVYAVIEGANDISLLPVSYVFQSQPTHGAVIGYTGAALVLAGLWSYRSERGLF